MVGSAIGWAVSPSFTVVMAVYVILTLAYSLSLKRIPLLDVFVIGTLFTLRVLMGTVLHDLPISPWLMSFSAFFFLSLALAKRHVEVMRMKAAGGAAIPGRGYQSGDWPLTLAFGVATNMSSVVIMMLFLNEQTSGNTNYSAPHWLYVAPAMVFLWIMRIWLLSHRMQLNDDPIEFALKDKTSYLLGLIVLAGFALAF